MNTVVKLEEKIVTLLQKGFNPRGISDEIGIDFNEVINILYSQVGKGSIKRSDILFSYKPEIRRSFEETIHKVVEEDIERSKNYKSNGNGPLDKLLEEMIKDPTTIELNRLDREELEWEDEVGLDWRSPTWQHFLKKSDEYFRPGIEPDLDLFKLYFELRKRQAWLSDLYIELLLAENSFHMLIQEVLSGKLGNEWWINLPEKTRGEIKKRNKSPLNIDSKELFCYTSLLDLSKIMRHYWNFFSIFFLDFDKRKLKDDFAKINNIRNSVMHPIRDLPTLNDLERVHHFYLLSKETLNTYDNTNNRKM